jgi:hypothetical protein
MSMSQEQQEAFLKQSEVAVISTVDELGRPRSRIATRLLSLAPVESRLRYTFNWCAM